MFCDKSYREEVSLFYNYSLARRWLSIWKCESQTSLDLVIVEGQATRRICLRCFHLFSLLDSAGIPVKDIALEDLTVSEDGQQVQLASLDSVEDEPIYVTLVLDTSGSMGGSKIAAARDAAKQFISGLNTDDKISIVSFNEQITQQLDYTTDHDVATNQVDFIDAVANSGPLSSCISAIQKRPLSNDGGSYSLTDER